ncbi:MAG: MerR family transcriptional regulator [Fimbriimonas sp.]
MPTIASYAKLAPFSLEELVSAVNSVLRDRPALAVQARTIRYYVSKGVIPPPGGSPKFARYDLPHLIGVVATRVLQDQGVSLEAARAQVSNLSIEEVQAMIERPARVRVSEQIVADYMHRPSTEPTTVTRLQLGHDLVLEIPANLDQALALELAAAAIREIQTQ